VLKTEGKFPLRRKNEKKIITPSSSAQASLAAASPLNSAKKDGKP
jgi:hypothetical protein